MAEELKLLFKVDKDGMVSVEQLEKKMGKVDKRVKDGNVSLGEMSNLLKSSIVVTGINQAIQLFHQFGSMAKWMFTQFEEGVEANRAQAYFQSMAEYAGRAGADVQAALSKVTLGELTETQTQQAFNTLIEVTHDVEASIAGVGLAFEYAQRTGKGFERAVQGIMSVMATGEATTAAKFGLFLDTTTLLERAAKAAGVDVDLLTGAQKRAAIQAEVTAQAHAKMAKGVFGAGNSAMQAAASMKDLQSAMQQAFAGGAPKGMSPLFAEVFAIPDLSEQVKEFALRTAAFQEEEARLQGVADSASAMYEASKAAGEGALELRKEVENATAALQDFQKQGSGSTDALSSNLQQVTADADEFLAKVEKIPLATRAMAGGVEDALAAREEQLSKLLRVLDETAQPGAEPTAAQEALSRAYGQVTEALRMQHEARALVTNGTVSEIQTLKDELAALTAAGQAAEERGAFLKTMIPVLEKVHANELALFDAVAKVPDAARTNMLANLGLSGESLTAAARGLRDIEERRKALDDAMRTGTDRAQELALENLAATGDRFVDTLRDMGVDEDRVAAAAEGMRRSLGGYSLAVDVAEGKTRGLGDALREFAGPYLEWVDKAKVAGERLSAELSRRAEEDRRAAEAGRRAYEERRRQRATDSETIATLQNEYAVLTGEMTEYQAVLAAIERTTYSTNDAQDAEIRLLHLKVAAERERQRQLQVFADMRQPEAEADLSGLIADAQTLAAVRFEWAELTGEMTAYEIERMKINALPEDTALQRHIKEGRLAILTEKELQDAMQQRVHMLYDVADAARESGRAFTDAASNVSRWASAFGESEVLGERGDLLFQNIQGMGDAIGNVIQSAAEGTQGLAQAGVGVFNALGATVAGMMPGVAEAAWLMAGLSAANALFLAFLDPVHAAQQAAAAVAYTALAVMAGGKKGAAASTVARSMGTATPVAQTGSGGSYTVYMGNNNVFADDTPKVGEKLIRHLAAAQYSGMKIPAGMGG